MPKTAIDPARARAALAWLTLQWVEGFKVVDVIQPMTREETVCMTILSTACLYAVDPELMYAVCEAGRSSDLETELFLAGIRQILDGEEPT